MSWIVHSTVSQGHSIFPSGVDRDKCYILWIPNTGCPFIDIDSRYCQFLVQNISRPNLDFFGVNQNLTWGTSYGDTKFSTVVWGNDEGVLVKVVWGGWLEGDTWLWYLDRPGWFDSVCDPVSSAIWLFWSSAVNNQLLMCNYQDQ